MFSSLDTVFKQMGHPSVSMDTDPTDTDPMDDNDGGDLGNDDLGDDSPVSDRVSGVFTTATPGTSHFIVRYFSVLCLAHD